MKNWIKPITQMGACREATKWCNNFDNLASAWAACERGDWMLWLLGELSGEPESDSRRELVLIACKCARLALPYVKEGEERPLKAIETAEAWARQENGITLEDVRAAADAAADAADAAADTDAYPNADANAANAGAYAAYVAYVAYAGNAAANAAENLTLKQCADIVREHSTFSAKK